MQQTQPLEVVFHYSQGCYAATLLNIPQQIHVSLTLPDTELEANHRRDKAAPFKTWQSAITSHVPEQNKQLCSATIN